MNEFVTIPANGLQVLNTVSSAMRPIFSMMNLKVAAQPAPRATPAMLFHCLAAVNEIHPMNKCLEGDEVSGPDRLYDQLLAVEGPNRAHSTFGRQFADFVAGQPFRPFLGHGASRSPNESRRT